MKTIAVLRSNPRDGGFVKILIFLSKKFKTDCYIWDRTGNYQPFFEHDNLSYVSYKNPVRGHDIGTLISMFFFNFWLFYKLIFSKIDCIHAIDLDTALTGLLVSKIKGIPFVFHCLDPYYGALPAHWPTFLEKVARMLENRVISLADVFIITDELRMIHHEGAKPRKFVEIANVPPPRVAEKPLAGERSKDFTVGYVGGLAEGRNLITLIHSVGELEKEGVRLVIGGFGPIEEQVENLSEKYENISFVGPVPYMDVLKVEANFDVFVHVLDPDSRNFKWGSPNKLFESMSLGKPIVVGDDTLIAKRVLMFGNGLIIKYGSKEELKEAILHLKNDSVLAGEMGEKGKKEFERNWTFEIMEERFLKAYNALALL